MGQESKVAVLEQVEAAALAHLQADLATQLGVIEAYWTARGSTIDLGTVQTWYQGHHPTIVEAEQSAFPMVAVICLKERPAGEFSRAGTTFAEQSDQWGYGEADIELIVNWFVYADTEDACNKVCKRWGEAIDAVMRDHRALGTNMELIQYVPQTELSTLARELPDLGSDVFYTQMGAKVWPVRVRYGE